MKPDNQRPIWRSTTILSVRKDGVVALGGDGQVSYGNTVMKSDTKKIRWMLDKRVLVGFAGSTADAFALMERFETKLKDYPGTYLAQRQNWLATGEPTVSCESLKP